MQVWHWIIHSLKLVYIKTCYKMSETEFVLCFMKHRMLLWIGGNDTNHNSFRRLRSITCLDLGAIGNHRVDHFSCCKWISMHHRFLVPSSFLRYYFHCLFKPLFKQNKEHNCPQKSYGSCNKVRKAGINAEKDGTRQRCGYIKTATNNLP